MKGVIELNWKILISIVAALLLFTVVFLILTGMLSTCSMSGFAKETCLLLISKLQIFGIGAEALQICGVFGSC